MTEHGKTKDLHVYLPPELFARVQEAARAERRSVNNWLLVLIEQEIERRASRSA